MKYSIMVRNFFQESNFERRFLFMSEKEFEKIYDEYREGLDTAPDSVRNAYSTLHDAFENYLCAIEEWTFRTAFEFALDYVAKTEMKKAV